MAETTWTPKQRHCIYCHDGTLLVSAAAGSGKTTVLVQRIIERITSPNHTDIDRLLVVTFTRAAATEMKSRLSGALAKLISENPHDANLQRQQLLLPRATIGTVDSFCGELVRQNFHLLNIPPQFRVAEEQQLSLLKKEALTQTLEEFYDNADSNFRELLAMLGANPDDQLMKLIEQVDSFLQSHPDPDAWLDSMSGIYDNANEIRNTAWGQYILHNVRAALNKAERMERTALMLVDQEPLLGDSYRPAIADDLSFIQRAYEACDMGTWDELLLLLEAYAPLDLRGGKKGADPLLKKRAQALRNAAKDILRALPARLCADEKSCLNDIAETGRLAKVLYAMVRRFSALFMEKKLQQRLFGFADIAHLALQLLVEKDESGSTVPSALARELSERYDEILMDEYQDTNELQDAVFTALSRNGTNMFFVGDVKQSIYGFRQAMPKLFLSKRDAFPLFTGANYPGTVLLDNNFRSRPQVTDATNFVFRQLMTKEFGGLSYSDGEELVPAAKFDKDPGYESELLLAGLTTPDGVKLSANEAEAQIIAERIGELVGTLMITQKDKPKRPLRYEDCCILVRSRTANEVYRRALEERGIPVVTDAAGEFFDTTEIRLALSLLRCIDNPLLDVPLTAWLLSPLCGFSPDDLAHVRRCRRDTALYNALTAARTAAPTEQLRDACCAAVAFLDRYRTLACQLTVDQLLRRLYEETALPELMSARADGKRRCNNLQLLQELCAQFNQSGFRGLGAFIRHVDKLQAQDISLPGAAKSDVEGAVRIYTIHGSKGLEFPVVFVAGLHHPFKNKRSSSTLLLHPEFGAGFKRRDPVTFAKYPTLPHLTLDIALGDMEREEELRLLYVAMTRAREKLCLTAAIGNPMKKLSELAATLEEAPTIAEYSARSASSMLNWILTAIIRHPSAAEWRREIDREDLMSLSADTAWELRVCTPKPIVDETAEDEEAPADFDEALVTQIRERIAYRYPHAALAQIPAKLAASATAHGELQRQYVAHAQPSFMQRASLSPAERGTAMHAFMQYAVYERAAQDVTGEVDRLLREGFLTETQAESLDRGKLTAFFADPLYGRMARSPRCLREYQFTSLQPASRLDPALASDEQLVIQGMADCVFEEDGALVIVDYKTDRVKTPEELKERYKAQLDIYRDALEKALAMPVRECVLYSFTLGRAIEV